MKILYRRNGSLIKIVAVDDDGNVVRQGMRPDSWGTRQATADVAEWVALKGYHGAEVTQVCEESTLFAF